MGTLSGRNGDEVGIENDRSFHRDDEATKERNDCARMKELGDIERIRVDLFTRQGRAQFPEKSSIRSRLFFSAKFLLLEGSGVD